MGVAGFETGTTPRGDEPRSLRPDNCATLWLQQILSNDRCALLDMSNGSFEVFAQRKLCLQRLLYSCAACVARSPRSGAEAPRSAALTANPQPSLDDCTERFAVSIQGAIDKIIIPSNRALFSKSVYSRVGLQLLCALVELTRLGIWPKASAASTPTDVYQPCNHTSLPKLAVHLE